MQLVYRTTVLLLFLSTLAFSRTAQAQVSPRPEPPVPDPAMVRALAGCYALELGAWSRPSRLGPEDPTTLVRLDTLPRHAGAFVAVRLAPADATPTPGRSGFGRPQPAKWRLVPPDSVAIVPWHTGFEAEVFYGRVVDSELRGVVRRTSDAVPVDPATGRILWDAYPTAPAVGRRVPCPPA